MKKTFADFIPFLKIEYFIYINKIVIFGKQPWSFQTYHTNKYKK